MNINKPTRATATTMPSRIFMGALYGVLFACLSSALPVRAQGDAAMQGGGNSVAGDVVSEAESLTTAEADEAFLGVQEDKPADAPPAGQVAAASPQAAAATESASSEVSDSSEQAMLRMEVQELRNRVQQLEFQLANQQADIPDASEAGQFVDYPAVRSDGSYEEGEIIHTDPNWGEGAWGDRWEYSLGVEFLGYYDDNLFLDPTDEVDDFIFVISPMIAVGRGDIEERRENYVMLRIQPALLLFTENSSENNIDLDTELELFIDFGKLSLLTEFRFQNYSGAENEVSGRSERNVFTSKIVIEREFTYKTSASFEQKTLLTDYDSREVDSNEYTFGLFFNYRYSEKLRLGLGGLWGYLDIDGADSQTYEQLQLRVNYVPSPKFLLGMRAGMEYRHYEDDDRLSPRLALDAEWLPFVNTAFFATAKIRERNSAVVVGSNYLNYGLEAGVRQKFLQRYTLTLSGGYQVFDYLDAATGDSGEREDDNYFLRASLDYKFRSWLSAGIFYLYRTNDSTVRSENWDNNQVGVRIFTEF